MSCLCDEHHCPTPFEIAAGLSIIPRAPADFPHWRLDILEAIGRQPELAEWRARETGDFGLMLVEMHAYVLAVASFYDQIFSNESYLATTHLAGAQRRHVGLLGYLPRPAFGALVWLAAEADGVRTITLPAGTAIRSGAFGAEPPQIFELGKPAVVEPRVNKLAIDRVVQTVLPSPLSGLSVEAGSVRTRAGDLVVLSAGGALMTTHVSGSHLLALRIRQPVSHIAFTAAISPPAGSLYAQARLLKAGARSGPWKLPPGAGELPVLSGSDLSLEGRASIQAGDIVAFEAGGVSQAARVTAVSEAQYTLLGTLQSTITDKDGNVSKLDSPPIKATVTRITVDVAIGFSSIAGLTVHYAMSDAATLHAPQKDTLDQHDPIVIPGLIDPPRTEITNLALQEVHGEGVVTTGVLDAVAHTADGADSPDWGRSLWAPVTLYGNVMAASRGETVTGELLGTGDASAPYQSFRLKKKPLTYLAAANASGRKSTLIVHVGGIRWDEVESFYAVPPDSQVYIVRHDEDGNTDIHFGGAARPPTGARVVADYRFGAGAAAPPADSVKQIAKPVAGLRAIRNILPAYGGADAEGPAELAIRGPRSALLLGRAVSLVDIETAAAQQPGVRAAHAAWRWDDEGLRPAVIVSYIGDPQLASSIRAKLRALAEDDAAISVRSASPQWARMDVDIDIDDRFVPGDVVGAVAEALFGAVTLPGTGGLLRAEQLGPEGVLFESVTVRAIVQVPGVAALRALTFNGSPFTDVGRKPAAGAYFDFAAGGVWINGQRAG